MVVDRVLSVREQGIGALAIETESYVPFLGWKLLRQRHRWVGHGTEWKDEAGETAGQWTAEWLARVYGKWKTSLIEF
jgi:hypothetical protein